MCFYSAKIVSAGFAQCLDKKQKDYGINTEQTHKAFFYSVSFWFLNCLHWRDAYKNYIMQKQLRIIISIYQFAHLVVLYFLFHLFLVWFSVGIFAGFPFITIPCQVLQFISFLVAGISGVILQVAVSFVHCPFRGFCKGTQNSAELN